MLAMKDGEKSQIGISMTKLRDIYLKYIFSKLGKTIKLVKKR